VKEAKVSQHTTPHKQIGRTQQNSTQFILVAQLHNHIIAIFTIKYSLQLRLSLNDMSKVNTNDRAKVCVVACQFWMSCEAIP